MSQFKSSRFLTGLLFGLFLGIIASITINEGIKRGIHTQLINIDSGLIGELNTDSEIINAHEIIQSTANAEVLLKVMDKLEISKTVLAGAPEETIFFTPDKKGFSKYDENNAQILEVKSKYPDRFMVFCTINPTDDDKITKIQQCLNQGADGIKLYSGHTFFYRDEYPLDQEPMTYIYRFAEEKGLPIIFHANLHYYKAQFEAVLSKFTKLKVVCPHYCVYTTRLIKLTKMLDRYPNLYLDISFGYKDYLAEGLERITQERDIFKDFFEKYQDRLLFATDVVLTSYEGKDEEWITQTYQTYKDLLTKEEFTYFLAPDKKFKGLNLSPETVKKIYFQNFIKLIQK